MSSNTSVWEAWKEINRLDSLPHVSRLSFIMGIVTAVFILSGVDIQPDSLVYFVIQSIINAFSVVPFWVKYAIAGVILVYGIVSGIRTIGGIALYGWKGIAASSTAFVSGVFFLLYSSSSVGLGISVMSGLCSIIVAFSED